MSIESHFARVGVVCTWTCISLCLHTLEPWLEPASSLAGSDWVLHAYKLIPCTTMSSLHKKTPRAARLEIGFWSPYFSARTVRLRSGTDPGGYTQSVFQSVKESATLGPI